MDGYLTVARAADDEFYEKKSRFIGYIRPVETEQAAAAFIASLKARHWDAVHNCSAYRLRAGQERYSDDGEPRGTAGPPILEVLRQERIEDAVIVVTRYFGGVLLGAGGLVRAYSRAAKLALDAAGRVQMCRCTRLEMSVPYQLYDMLSRMMGDYSLRVLATDFAEEVTVRVLLRSGERAAFERQLAEISAGGLRFRPLGEEFDAI